MIEVVALPWAFTAEREHSYLGPLHELKPEDFQAMRLGYHAMVAHIDREVGRVHPKAVPVILTRPEEWAQWLSAPTPRALELQRPLPDGELDIVAEGARADGP